MKAHSRTCLQGTWTVTKAEAAYVTHTQVPGDRDPDRHHTHTGSHTGRRPVVSWVSSVLIWERTQHLPRLSGKFTIGQKPTNQKQPIRKRRNKRNNVLEHSRTFSNSKQKATKCLKSVGIEPVTSRVKQRVMTYYTKMSCCWYRSRSRS